MPNITRVLAPTDFSSYGFAAMQYAKNLARTLGAELHVLHVASYGFNEYMAEAGAAYRKPYHEFETTLLTIAEEQMQKALAKAECENATSHVVLGCPAPEVLAYANSNDINLIVMGTHGRTGLANLLIGSVAESVVRRAECPVLTVRGTTATSKNAREQPTESVA